MENNEVINAIKRLERAGSENSRATAKLHKAAIVLAAEVIRIAPDGESLPRGYQVRVCRSNIGYERYLVCGQQTEDDWGNPQDVYIDGTGSYQHGDFQCWIPAQTRAGSLQFAHDVATGWLEELATWLEKRAADEAAATATLEAARV